MPSQRESTKLEQLRLKEYELRLEIDHLRRVVYGQVDPAASADKLAELIDKERELKTVEEQIVAAVEDLPDSGLILDSTQRATGRRKAETTGIEVKMCIRDRLFPHSGRPGREPRAGHRRLPAGPRGEDPPGPARRVGANHA